MTIIPPRTQANMSDMGLARHLESFYGTINTVSSNG
jgi:hypothetical protein